MSDIHYASVEEDGSGAVYACPTPCTFDEAVEWRQAGRDVVVRGPDEADNLTTARQIEEAATDDFGAKHDRAHLRTAGSAALPHYQPWNRPPTGHTFYETPTKKAVIPR